MTAISKPGGGLVALIAAERRRQRWPLMAAGAAAATAVIAAACLLGLSGWFITGAAVAGATGAVMAFNYLLPSACIRLLAILRTIGRYFERLEGHRAALGALASIRPALFHALAKGPPQAALGLSAGEASARLIQDVDEIETLLVRLSGRWAAVAALVAGAALTALAGWKPAAATILVFLAAVIGARLIARRLSRRPGAETLQAMGRLKDCYAGLAAAAPELVCYGLQEWAAERLRTESSALDLARLKVARAQGWQSCLALLLAAAAAAAALLLSHGADLKLAALASLAAAITVEGVGGLARAFERDGAVAEASLRLDPLLAARRDEDGGRRPVATDPRLSVVTSHGELIVVQQGGRLAIAGPSGCGKTTLIEEFLKLRDPDGVRLLIDGATLADLSPAQARAAFAYCPQAICLLSGSVRDNLLLADPHASDASLWEALFDAGLDQRVGALPHGIDSWIGDGGDRLSGGERRRLALARAMLRHAPWLLLDEPTEGLDEATEAVVLDRLDARLTRRSQGLVVVSHRPAALRLCTRILRLDAGAQVPAWDEPATPGARRITAQSS